MADKVSIMIRTPVSPNPVLQHIGREGIPPGLWELLLAGGKRERERERHTHTRTHARTRTHTHKDTDDTEEANIDDIEVAAAASLSAALTLKLSCLDVGEPLSTTKLSPTSLPTSTPSTTAREVSMMESARHYRNGLRRVLTAALKECEMMVDMLDESESDDFDAPQAMSDVMNRSITSFVETHTHAHIHTHIHIHTHTHIHTHATTTGNVITRDVVP